MATLCGRSLAAALALRSQRFQQPLLAEGSTLEGLPKLEPIERAHESSGSIRARDGTAGIPSVMGSPVLGNRSVQAGLVASVLLGFYLLSPARVQFAHLQTRQHEEAAAVRLHKPSQRNRQSAPVKGRTDAAWCRRRAGKYGGAKKPSLRRQLPNRSRRPCQRSSLRSGGRSRGDVCRQLTRSCGAPYQRMCAANPVSPLPLLPRRPRSASTAYDELTDSCGQVHKRQMLQREIEVLTKRAQ